MLFRILIIFPFVQVIFNNGLQSECSSEKDLEDIVNEFYQQTHPEGLKYKYEYNNVNNLPNAKFGFNSYLYNDELKTLVYGIYLVLQQLNNYKINKLPERHTVVENTEYPLELSHDNEEQILCSLIPRCLDFVHIYTNNIIILLSAYILHAKLCHSWQTLIKQTCSLSKSRVKNVYLCNDKSIISFYDTIYDTILTSKIFIWKLVI